MTYQEILDKTKPELEKLEEEFKNKTMEIRAGRLSPALIENIKIDCFGSSVLLKQLGTVSVSGREIIVQLWDRTYLEGVIKAIEQRGAGLGVKIDGNTLYLSTPPLTEESKKNLIKILSQEKEEVFQNIRRLRDKSWKEIRDGFQNKEIREDDKFRGKDKLEDLIKESRERIEKMAENKIKEIEE